jgi:hypothetical protein
MSNESQFVTFQKFNDKGQAMELGSLLDKNKIEYILEDNSPRLDASFGGGELSKEYAIKLRKEDFEPVNHLLIEASVNDLDSIDKNYYLFSFTNEELRDVIVKKDEWNAFDFLLAQKLLSDRGKAISEEELSTLQDQRLGELAQPEKPQSATIIAGYIFALLGGIVGIIIGWYLSTNKKTLPNGDSVYIYSESDRRHGRIIIALGIAVLIIGLIIKVFTNFFKNYQC